MSTKLAPGTFDCYRAALPDEPMFILLARDASAPDRLREWADGRRKLLLAEKLERPQVDEDKAWNDHWKQDMAKCRDADMIANDMVAWRACNDGVWRNVAERPPFAEINPALKDEIADVTRRRLISALVVGTGQVMMVRHRTRSWSRSGFNVRTHTLNFESSSEAFQPLVDGKALELDDWHVAGFDVMLGDVEYGVPSPDRMWIRLQTVEGAS